MKEELAISQGYGFGRRKSKIESNEDEIESERTETSVETETSSTHSAVTTFIQERYRHIVDNTINSVLFIIKKHEKMKNFWRDGSSDETKESSCYTKGNENKKKNG